MLSFEILDCIILEREGRFNLCFVFGHLKQEQSGISLRDSLANLKGLAIGHLFMVAAASIRAA